jgi:multiple sugar transport system permease protein
VKNKTDTGRSSLKRQQTSWHNERRREAVAGYLFVLPVVLGFIIWVLGPIIATIAISFTNWPVIGKANWVGVRNYLSLFNSQSFFPASLKATVYYAFGDVVVRILYSFVVALLLNQKVIGRPAFRTIYYLPSIVPLIASSMIWLWCFQPDFGLFNTILKAVGMQPLRWIYGTGTVVPSFVLMDVWAAGNTIIIFLAGLQAVPTHLLDAVAIDGGNWWHRLTAVTLPHTSPLIFFNAVLGFVNAFQVFTQAFVMSGGGPSNHSLFLVLLVYREGFQNMQMGLAATTSLALFVIIAVLTAVMFRSARSWVFYYGEEQ